MGNLYQKHIFTVRFIFRLLLLETEMSKNTTACPRDNCVGIIEMLGPEFVAASHHFTTTWHNIICNYPRLVYNDNSKDVYVPSVSPALMCAVIFRASAVCESGSFTSRLVIFLLRVSQWNHRLDIFTLPGTIYFWAPWFFFVNLSLTVSPRGTLSQLYKNHW